MNQSLMNLGLDSRIRTYNPSAPNGELYQIELCRDVLLLVVHQCENRKEQRDERMTTQQEDKREQVDHSNILHDLVSQVGFEPTTSL